MIFSAISLHFRKFLGHQQIFFKPRILAISEKKIISQATVKILTLSRQLQVLVKPYPDPTEREVTAVKVVLIKSIIVFKSEGKYRPLTYGMENDFEKYEQTDQTH